MHPCLNPCYAWNHPLVSPWIQTFDFWFSNSACMRATRCFANPMSTITFHSFLWFTLSKAFSKSTKLMYSGCLRDWAFSVRILRLHRWLCVSLCGLKLACSSATSNSVFGVILLRMTFSSILLAWDIIDHIHLIWGICLSNRSTIAHWLAFYHIEFHLPTNSPLANHVQVTLQLISINLTGDLAGHLGIICKFKYMTRCIILKVIDKNQEQNELMITT